MVGRTVLTVVLALGSGVGLSDALVAESLPGPVKWGLTTDGLRIAIYPARSGPVPATGADFYVALQNVGESHFILNLGAMFGNAKLMLPLHVRLIVTDSTGRTRELKNQGSQRGLRAGGSMDDFIVALPVGSTYTLRLNMDDYWSWSPPTAEFGLKQAVGKHRNPSGLRWSRYAGVPIIRPSTFLEGQGRIERFRIYGGEEWHAGTTTLRTNCAARTDSVSERALHPLPQWAGWNAEPPEGVNSGSRSRYSPPLEVAQECTKRLFGRVIDFRVRRAAVTRSVFSQRPFPSQSSDSARISSRCARLRIRARRRVPKVGSLWCATNRPHCASLAGVGPPT
jgi:hypothetical protein